MSKTTARERLKAEQAKQRSRDRRILIIVAAGIVVLLIAGGIGFQFWRTSQQPSAGPTPAGSATPVRLTNGQPVLFGSSAAPVQIQLYADFHCPACDQFERSYGEVLNTAQQSGKAAIQFYPLSFHDPGSVSAANAFGCAAEAGFGQAYFAGLFANASLDWNDDQLLTLAQQVSGAPPSDAFKTCVTGRAHQGYLESITAAADRAGVSSTPTVLMNGKPIDLASVSPDQLAKDIDAAAAGK